MSIYIGNIMKTLRNRILKQQLSLINKNIYKYSVLKDDKKKVNITFINKDETETEVEACIGDSILEVAHKNGIDLEGACESSLACSTCHVIL